MEQGQAAPLHTHAYCFSRAPPSAPPTALILLNSASPYTPLHLSLLRAVWPFSAVRLAADGAGSRLFFALLEASGAGTAPGAEGSPEGGALLRRYLPNAVCGDFDSLAPRAAAFYGAAGVALHPAPHDQDSTDFEKCLARLEEIQAARGGARFNVVALGAGGGRLDHEAQCLSALLARAGAFAGLALLSPHSVASALPAGRTHVAVAAPFEGPTCGLLPLAGPAVLTTRGLQWDVAGWHTAFGGRVSTSNCVKNEGGGVLVETSAPLIWTICVNAEEVVEAAGAGSGGTAE